MSVLKSQREYDMSKASILAEVHGRLSGINKTSEQGEHLVNLRDVHNDERDLKEVIETGRQTLFKSGRTPLFMVHDNIKQSELHIKTDVKKEINAIAKQAIQKPKRKKHRRSKRRPSDLSSEKTKSMELHDAISVLRSRAPEFNDSKSQVDLKDFSSFVSEIESGITMNDTRIIFDTIDKNSKGHISATEYTTWINKPLSDIIETKIIPLTPRTVSTLKSFRLNFMDMNATNKMDINQFIETFNESFIDIATLRAVFVDVDQTRDGYITPRDFLSWLHTPPKEIKLTIPKVNTPKLQTVEQSPKDTSISQLQHQYRSPRISGRNSVRNKIQMFSAVQNKSNHNNLKQTHSRKNTFNSVYSIPIRMEPKKTSHSDETTIRLTPTSLDQLTASGNKTHSRRNKTRDNESSGDNFSFRVVSETEFRLLRSIKDRVDVLQKQLTNNQQSIDNAKKNVNDQCHDVAEKIRSDYETYIEVLIKDMQSHLSSAEENMANENRMIVNEINRLNGLEINVKSGIENKIDSIDDLEKRSSKISHNVDIENGIKLASIEEKIVKCKVPPHIADGLMINPHEIEIELPFVLAATPAIKKTNLNNIKKNSLMSTDSPVSLRNQHDHALFTDISHDEQRHMNRISPRRHMNNQIDMMENLDECSTNTFSVTIDSPSNVELYSSTITGFSRKGKIFEGRFGTQRPDKWTQITSNDIDDRALVSTYPATCVDKINKKFYRFGGVANGKQINNSEVFNWEEQSWREISSMHTFRQDASAVLMDNTIFVIGGARKYNHNGQDKWQFYNSIEQYNITDDYWLPDVVPSMNHNRYAFASIGLPSTNEVLVFGGNSDNGRLKSTEIFNIFNDEWRYLADMPVAKTKHGAINVGDQMYIIGGDSKSHPTKSFGYNIERNQWYNLPDTNSAHERPILDTVASTKQLVVIGNKCQTDSFEILDERSGKWIETDIMNHPINVEFRGGIFTV